MTDNLNNNDHDLLIRVDEQIKELRRAVVDLKDNVVKRVSDLEMEKINKETVLAMKKDQDAVIKDHESRIREDESFRQKWSGKNGIIGAVALIILSAIVSIAADKLF